MKNCSGCGRVLPLTSFYRCRRDGHQSRCKECQKQSKRQHAVEDEGQRECRKCRQMLPLSSFHVDRKLKNGRSWVCKSCRCAVQAERDARRPKHPLTVERAELLTRGLKRCNDCRQILPLSEFWASGTGHVGVAGYESKCCRCSKREAAEWRDRNREHTRSYARQYRTVNAATVRLWKAVRRLRLRCAKGFATVEQIVARWEFYGGRCWMCGSEADTLDHVKPIVSGGSNWPSNLRPACRSCNSRKGSRPWQEFSRLSRKEKSPDGSYEHGKPSLMLAYGLI